jgi:hypothetical protein
MASDQTITLTQLSGLLESVEASAKSLRTYLETKIKEEAKVAQKETSYAEGIANSLSLPLHADPKIVNQVSFLRISCERVAHLVTPPRHFMFEAAGSVSCIQLEHEDVTDGIRNSFTPHSLSRLF